MNIAALQISTDHMDHLATLPAVVRNEVMELVAICQSIKAAKSESAGIKAAAKRNNHRRGFSAASIRRKYYAWKKDGWQVLIDRSKVGKANTALNIGETFKGYCERNQRSSKQAYKTMMDDFRIHNERFPEVGTWADVWAAERPDEATPYNCPLDFIPRGWTYANLMKCCGLTKYEIAASRIGKAKARDFLPSVYSTRLNLLPGMIYMYDDMWHDARVNFLGVNIKARRPIELACVDVASACRFLYGLKPRKEDIETGKLKNLCGNDMRMLLAYTLVYEGYHPAGCEMIVEHGTAAAGMELELLIGCISGGEGYIDREARPVEIVWNVPPVVRFSRSGILSDPIHKGLFCGQAKGNPKRKAALESQHGLAHTVAAALAGQMGKDRDHSPEQQYGLQQYNTQLIKAAAALPPERAKLLMYPLLPFDQYKSVIADLYREMNWRTEHDLEGWEECGHVASEFRLHPTSNDWMPMDKLFELPEEERDRMLPLLQLDGLCRTRKLSPQEVWNAGKDALVRFPKSSMPQLLGRELGIIKPILEDGLIIHSDQELGPSEYRYRAETVIDPHGFKIPLVLGKSYLIHINPFELDECFVSELKSGAYIGLALRWKTVCKDDSAALERQSGIQAAIESERRTPIARRGQKVIKQKIEMHKNNTAVFRGDAVSPDEKAELVRVRKVKGDLNDIYEAPLRQGSGLAGEEDDFDDDDLDALDSIY